MPTISPARTSKSIGPAAPCGCRPRTCRRGSPIVRLPAGYSDSILRPTIDAMRLSWSNSAIGLHVTRPPSRRIVTRSPISNISSRWWLTYMIAWPSSRSAWMRASSAFVSLSDSAVVGSSKMSTRGVGAEHLGDLDELADGQRERRDLGARVEPVQADALEHRRATGGAARPGG